MAIMAAANGIIGLAVPFLGTVATVIIGGPFLLSISTMFLRIYKGENVALEQLFEGFSDFARTFTAYLLMCIYIVLWAILLIIPGLVAALGYSMTFFIMAEDPNISAQDALRKSKEMMTGHKWDLFWLSFSFIGWIILAAFTFGIGFLWLNSYMYASYVVFYQNLKSKNGVNANPEKEPEFTVIDNGY